ncbi:von Willebrand factor type A domain-containing protein [Bisporella sp. PMI_857]|nr:von Willebrand factor type A domain-containing protein [Bisporella sp. PMI_857]
MSGFLCGCYYFLPVPFPAGSSAKTKTYLPLLDSEVHTTILSATSKTVLKQKFTNPSGKNIEKCVYTFPIYDGVSVVGFTCKVGGKTLTGVVKEKRKAKKIFDDAVAKGETAGLLEQEPQASDVWSTALGNIPANEKVIVEITYISELKHHDSDGIRFTIPTNIAPRYGSGPTQHSLPPNEDGGIKITADISMPQGSSIKSVDSPSHQIKVLMGTVSTAIEADPSFNKASATLSLGTTALEKDFVLMVQAKDVGIPKAILETHPTLPQHRALMATLVPKFSIPPSSPEIVFVADRSGSMGHNIPMLKSALKVFLKSLPAGIKFNICSFGNSHRFLWPKSQTYKSETLEAALKHIESFSANMGGTETYNAIKATIEQRFGDIPLEVILLTDGDIWNQESLFSYVNEQVAESKGEIRIFTLGIGNGVSHSLIEGLSRAGNGFSQAVQEGERFDTSIVRMLRGSLTPHILNYTLAIKYEQDDDDFELIDRVSDSLKVLLNDETRLLPAIETKKPPAISLFDPSIKQDTLDVEMKDAEVNLPEVPYPKLLQAPHQIPSLFAFVRTTVYLLMSPETIQKNPTSVVLSGTTTTGQELSLEIPVEVLSTPSTVIHQLAAKKAVQALEEGRGWIFDAKDEAGKLVKDKFPSSFADLVQKEAVRLGEKFQVAGKWCSFVAVSENGTYSPAQETPADNREDAVSGYYNVAMTEGSINRPSPITKSRAPGAFAMGSFGGPSSKVLRGLTSQQRFSMSVNAPAERGRQASAMAPASPALASAPPPPLPRAPASAARKGGLTKAKKTAAFHGMKAEADGAALREEASAPTIERSAVSRRKSAAENVLALIDLQRFDGSWVASSALPSILGITIPGGKGAEWITALVVRWLEIKCPGEEGTWNMVVEKARGWLGRAVKDLGALEGEVSVLVNDS